MAFLGQQQFAWGIGVCEDRFDPEGLGRVRVRWLGLHTDNKQDILTKDLPWAQVMQTNNPAVAGIGQSPSLAEGTWVVGFSKDPDTLQEWVVMGTLPGENITTANRGGTTLGRAWAQARGDYNKFMESISTKIPSSSTEYKDYTKGFYDPTVDQRNIPHPPSTMSYGNIGTSWNFTPSVKPPLVDYTDVDKGIPRVPNWTDATGGDHPSIQDLDKVDAPIWQPVEDFSPSNVTRATHSDMLHYLYKTTRRITADSRWKPAWTDFGTFRWPDTFTYTEDGEDILPEETKAERKRYETNTIEGALGVIISTGYMEPDYWSEDKDYGSKGGTYGPAFPITRDTPARSTDPMDLTGIDPLDTRAGWGDSGGETGYWALKGESYRVTHPRVKLVAKTHLSPTERETVMKLFDSGQYGTGEYNISDPEEGRQDIKWNDVKESDLVVVPTPDTNPLALGGIPISSCDGTNITTASTLWGDSTTYFSDPDLSKGEPAKPRLQAGDIVQIAGVRGMQEINGRIFRLKSCSDNGTSFTMTLGTVDGAVWSGPSGIVWKHIDNSIGEWEAPTVDVDNSKFSAYLGGGVVIPHNPHWSLCWKADMRERQINIGSPNPETGEEYKMWNQPTGDFNARYPFNHVYETESGHIMEYDDTPGGERIAQMHRSGTHYEIDHNGTKTDYVKGDNYDIRLHDDYMYVKGKVAHTFDDAVMIRYNDRADISAKWKLQLWSGGDLDIHSKRNINMKSDGDINLQADGHINLHGTGVTQGQTEEYRSGTRNAKERSAIKMKAGHINMEAVGDEALPKKYGVYVQSDQAPIGMKTLMGGDAGDIHIAAAEDMELFAWKNHYREAHEDDIYDYAVGNYRLEVEKGSLDVTVVDGAEVHTVKDIIDIKSCTEDIRIQSLAKDINLKAKLNILMQAEDDDIEMTAAKNINLKAGVDYLLDAGDDIMMYAADEIRARAASHILVSSTGGDIKLDAGIDVHVKGALDVHIEAVAQSIHQLAGEMILITGTDYVDIGASIVNVEASAINLNGTATSATAASSAFGPSVVTPVLPDDAISSLPSKKAWIPETMELLSIDLPNPNPASGYEVTSLALNINDNAGYGGENIRNLHDTIENMQKGLSAYVTKTYPSTSEAKTYDTEQNAHVATGVTTFVLEEPWNGYKGEALKMEPLGKEGPKRYDPVAPPC